MSEITKSIQMICDEKGLNYETVMEAVESALAAAYRKDFGNRQQNIKVKFDPEKGNMKAWDVKEVVEDIDPEKLEADQAELSQRRENARKEDRELNEEELSDLVQFNPKNQIMLTPAKEIKKDAAVGDTLEIELETGGDFGRMAAQTAKQVIIQKLREAERNTIFEDFKKHEGHIVQGAIQRRDRNGSIIIDIGKITGLLPVEEQIQREQYRPGSRMKFYVISVEMGPRGPEILLSRSSKRMIEEIFKQVEIVEKNIQGLYFLLEKYKKSQEEVRTIPKLTDGNEVMEILKIPPSPILGKILKDLKEAQISGDVNTHEEALKFIKGYKL